MPKSSFKLIVGLINMVVLAALVVYGVLPNFKAWQTTEQSYQLLSTTSDLGAGLAGEITLATDTVQSLNQRMQGDSATLPRKQVESHIIGSLQHLAWSNNVQLSGVVPREGEVVDLFREILFDVKLSGDYFDIHAMLSDFQRKLGFVVVKRFNLEPKPTSDQKQWLGVEMTLASYRIEL